MSRQLVLLFSVGEKAARVNAEIVFVTMPPPFVIASERNERRSEGRRLRNHLNQNTRTTC